MRKISIALTTVGMLGIAAAAAVAIVGYGLYDVDILINRTLVYGVMTGVVLLIYAVVVGGAGLLFQTQGSPLLAILATALVAILFQPIYARLQRGVNRLLYGRRDEPFEVLARLGQQLEQTITADSAFPTIVETVAKAMRLPYVAIQTRQDSGRQTVESYGVPGREADRVAYDLVFQGEVVGWLQVGRRSPGEAFSRADDRLLRNIARQAGAAVYNARLTADLQRSRQEIITSREEERRRLRRDLHDGLGPALASLLLEARVLRRLVRDDPPAAEALADEMQGDIRATIDDIRRVVHELRPPALDDLGLVMALNVMAAKTGAAKTGAAKRDSLTSQRPATAACESPSKRRTRCRPCRRRSRWPLTGSFRRPWLTWFTMPGPVAPPSGCGSMVIWSSR
jgi:signal transduction histidine kinase